MPFSKIVLHVFVIAVTACSLYSALIFFSDSNTQATREIIFRKFREAEESFKSNKYELTGFISQQILSKYYPNLSDDQKHQLGVYLWHSDRQREAFELFDENKLDEKFIEKIATFFQPIWQKRIEALDTINAAEKLCRVLRRYMLQTVQSINLIDNAGHYCINYDLVAEGEIIYNRFMEALAFSDVHPLNQLEMRELARGNVGMGKINAGNAAGKEDVIQASKNILAVLPKARLNPPGRDKTPHNLLFIDYLSGFPNRTIHHKTDEKLTINAPIPPNSGLGRPQIVEIEDRDVQLVEISEIYQTVFGLFMRKNHDFIVYDTGIIKTVDTFTSIALKNNISEYPTHYIEEAVFTSVYQDNYYHWIIEGMSRLVFLIENGFFREHPNATVTHLLDKPFIPQTLDLINFPKGNRQAIKYLRQGVNTYYNKLYVPVFSPWENPTLQPLNPTQMHIPPPSLIRLLNKYYNPNPLPLHERTKIIYAGRPEITPRNTPFDYQLVLELRKVFGSDLVVLSSPPPSVAAQKEMFAKARIIVGPHGAALSNMIFAAPNQTAVIVFPIKTIQFDHPFSNIAASLGMYYWTLPAVNAFYLTNYMHSADTIPTIVQAVVQAAQFMQTLE